MKNYRMLAWRELWAQRVTSLLILFAVILSTVMTATLSQSMGVLSAMRQKQAIALGGDRCATFVQMNQEQVTALEKDPRLSFVGKYVTLGMAEINASLTLGLNEYEEDVAAIYPSLARIKEGRLPRAPMEIALPEDVLQYLDFQGELGDSIPLALSKALRHGIEIDAYDFEADFVLVGITESNYLNYTGGTVSGIVGPGTAKALLPERYFYYCVDIRTSDRSGFQDTMDDLTVSLKIHELDTIYNVVYLEALGIRYDEESADTELSSQGFSYMLAAGVTVGALLLFAAGLVIYNILKIAVARRIRHYGVLRAMGGEKGQLYFTVAAQVLLLCAAGIPAGLLLGALSAKGILIAATGLLPPELFLVQNTEELNRLIAENSSGKGFFLLAGAVLTLFSAFIAAAPAARYAARVSPVTAMAGSPAKIRRKSRRARRIRSFEAFYARLNLRRSPGRTAITILSLVMSITVFLVLQSFTALLDTSAAMSEHLGDYSVVNERTGISPGELGVLEADENVSAVAAEQFSLYELDEQNRPIGVETDISLGLAEKFQIFGLNDCWMEDAFSESLTPKQLEQLRSGEGCVVRNPIPMQIEGTEIGTTHIEEGARITIAGKEMPVLLSLSGYDRYFSVGNSGFINGVQVVVSDGLYPALTGEENYAELRPILAAGANREAFDETLERFCREVPGSLSISYEQTDRQLAESFEQIRLLAWGLILFVALIGLLNIVNTVYTGIHTRVMEIGIQRALGMSVPDLYKVFLWEGAYYGLIAAVIGGIAGYLASLLTEAAATGAFRFVAVPIGSIALAAVFAVGACLMATCIPLRRVSRMSIVESIETVE